MGGFKQRVPCSELCSTFWMEVSGGGGWGSGPSSHVYLLISNPNVFSQLLKTFHIPGPRDSTCRSVLGLDTEPQVGPTAQEFSHSFEPGEPIDVLLPLTDLVEVSFTPSDAVQPSNLQICTVENEKIQCSPDYKERASLLNILQIKDGNVSDSGNYTVRDLVNNETLTIVTAPMRDEPVSQTRSRGRRSAPEPCPHIKPCPDIKQQEGVPVWVVVLILVVLLVVVAVLVVGSVMYVRLRRENQQLRENAENNGLPLLQQNGNTVH